MKGLEATEIVSDLASQQWGLVTSTQAKNNGVDLPSLRRLKKRGALVPYPARCLCECCNHMVC